MRRREFITLLSGAAATWTITARAQRQPMPVVGYLGTRSLGDSAYIVAAFRKGLHEVGYSEGRNMVIAYRFAEGHHDRCRDGGRFRRLNVHVFVVTGGTASVVAAKTMMPATIPMVFAIGGGRPDQAKSLVGVLRAPAATSLAISFLVSEMAAKHVRIAETSSHRISDSDRFSWYSNNRKSRRRSKQTARKRSSRHAQSASSIVVKASTESDFDPAFKMLVQERVEALFVQGDPFITDHRASIVALASRHRLPAIYALREFVDAGGLMSYGTSITDANRQLGIYTGRVLKGAKPTELPIMQSTIFELVINLKVAKALGLDVPTTVLVTRRRSNRMKRREFITALGGASLAWPMPRSPLQPNTAFPQSTSGKNKRRLGASYRMDPVLQPCFGKPPV